MTRAHRRRGQCRPEVDVNLASLIDVVFILLIAFMIVAPELKHGLNVDLARVEGGEALMPERPISVVITCGEGDEEPRFYLEGDRVSLERLRTRLEARVDLTRGAAAASVLVEPDALVPTEATLQVLGIILDLGIANYGFVTEPLDEE